MPKFNKSRGFKQAGFTYPGVSPLKGAKAKARKLAATTKRQEATKAAQDAMVGDAIKSTNILDSQGFSIQGGGVAPIKNQTDPENEADAEYYGSEEDIAKNSKSNAITPKKTFKESFKGAMGSEMGKTVGNAVAKAGVDAVVGALTKPKKEKPKRQAPNMSGFSNIKMGRK